MVVAHAITLKSSQLRLELSKLSGYARVTRGMTAPVALALMPHQDRDSCSDAMANLQDLQQALADSSPDVLMRCVQQHLRHDGHPHKL
eukprot:4998312-Amphidinium_carterae.1